jgi:hypothetical protein
MGECGSRVWGLERAELRALKSARGARCVVRQGGVRGAFRAGTILLRRFLHEKPGGRYSRSFGLKEHGKPLYSLIYFSHDAPPDDSNSVYHFGSVVALCQLQWSVNPEPPSEQSKHLTVEETFSTWFVAPIPFIDLNKHPL